MAIALSGLTTNNVSFGDLAGLAGQSALSFALVLKVNSLGAEPREIAHQWSTSGADRNFTIRLSNTDEIAFYVGNGTTLFGRETTTVNFTNGNTYRIVCTVLFGSPPVMHIYVNGSEQTLTALASNDVTSSLDSTSAVKVGYDVLEDVNAIDGDYAEFAIWQRELTSGQALEYTANNRYPTCCGPTGLIYLPMTDTTTLTDQWSSVTATLTGGSNATHPTMVACAATNLPFMTRMTSRRT